jgi:hypothetical protein
VIKIRVVRHENGKEIRGVPIYLEPEEFNGKDIDKLVLETVKAFRPGYYKEVSDCCD